MSKAGSDPTVKVLVFGASQRADSVNQKLAALAARVAEKPAATGDLADVDRVDRVAS